MVSKSASLLSGREIITFFCCTLAISQLDSVSVSCECVCAHLHKSGWAWPEEHVFLEINCLILRPAVVGVYPIGIPVLYIIVFWKPLKVLNPAICSGGTSESDIAHWNGFTRGNDVLPAIVRPHRMAIYIPMSIGPYWSGKGLTMNGVKARTENPELTPSMFMCSNCIEDSKPASRETPYAQSGEKKDNFYYLVLRLRSFSATVRKRRTILQAAINAYFTMFSTEGHESKQTKRDILWYSDASLLIYACISSDVNGISGQLIDQY